jgi:hypothetical protein
MPMRLQMASSATIDGERSIYAAQMKAMRRLKGSVSSGNLLGALGNVSRCNRPGDLLRANTDLGQFFAETVASKVDNAHRVAEAELAEATHKARSPAHLARNETS